MTAFPRMTADKHWCAAEDVSDPHIQISDTYLIRRDCRMGGGQHLRLIGPLGVLGEHFRRLPVKLVAEALGGMLVVST